jgi:hypothetical protein
MFSAILAILILFITDLGRTKGLQFRPISKTVILVFGINFAILMILGACHVENPFIAFGQISTVFYFVYFIIIGGISLVGNSVIKLSRSFSKSSKSISSINKYNLGNNLVESGTSFWAMIAMISSFLFGLMKVVFSGDWGLFVFFIDKFFNLLKEISSMAANNQLSEGSARALLGALRAVSDRLPEFIEFLKNCTSNILNKEAIIRTLVEVVKPAVDRTIGALIELIKRLTGR